MSPTYVLEMNQPKRCGPGPHGTYKLVMRRVLGTKAAWKDLFLPLYLMYMLPFPYLPLQPKT